MRISEVLKPIKPLSAADLETQIQQQQTQQRQRTAARRQQQQVRQQSLQQAQVSRTRQQQARVRPVKFGKRGRKSRRVKEQSR